MIIIPQYINVRIHCVTIQMEEGQGMKRLSMPVRLGIIFILLLLPIIGMMSYFNKQSEQNLAHQVSDTLEELIKQNNKLIETELDRIMQVTTSLILEESAQTIGKESDMDEVFMHNEYRTLNTLLRNESFIDPSDLTYHMIYPEKNASESNMDFYTIGEKQIQFLNGEEIQQWYEKITADFGRPTLTLIENNNEESLAFVRSINDIFYYGNTLGMIVVSDIQNIIMENQGTINSFDIRPYLLNEENQILYGDKENLTADVIESALFKDTNVSTVVDNHIYISANNEKYDYTLLFQVPIDTLTERQSQLTTNLIFITVLYFIFAALIAVYLAKTYVLPLQKLTIFFRSYLPGHVLNDSSLEGKGEIFKLMASVRDMTQRMKKLIIDNYQSEIKYKEMELNRLQEQINPHLLYNTLESIQWNSIMNEDFETASMVNDLSALMKLGLSQGRDLITIKEERDHLVAYMNLQQKRFESPFTTTIQLDEELYEFLIPKISLQPLVENSIKYGVKKMGEEGIIKITGEIENDRIVLKVLDNGFKDIDVDKLNDSLRMDRATEGQGVGILNVNRRIKHHFGNEYGLTYRRTEEKWTEVTIRLPKVERVEETDVSDSNRR